MFYPPKPAEPPQQDYALRRHRRIPHISNGHRPSAITETNRMFTHIKLLHAHGVQHMSQEFVGILLSEVEILVVLAADSSENLSVGKENIISPSLQVLNPTE